MQRKRCSRTLPKMQRPYRHIGEHRRILLNAPELG